jgi:hypothetical protein
VPSDERARPSCGKDARRLRKTLAFWKWVPKPPADGHSVSMHDGHDAIQLRRHGRCEQKKAPGVPELLIQFPPLISHYRRTSSMRWPKVAARTCVGKWRGEEGMYLLTVIRAIRAALTHRRYRPELHYMRGPGPKWFERHGR